MRQVYNYHREAQEYIAGKYMVQLKNAPFSLSDKMLIPAAGACNLCQKLASNNRKDYPDARGDICTDPACYAEKWKAHNLNVCAQRAQQPAPAHEPATTSEPTDVFAAPPPTPAPPTPTPSAQPAAPARLTSQALQEFRECLQRLRQLHELYSLSHLDGPLDRYEQLIHRNA